MTWCLSTKKLPKKNVKDKSMKNILPPPTHTHTCTPVRIQSSFSRVKHFFWLENLTRAVLVEDENAVGVCVDAVLGNGNVTFMIVEVVVDAIAVVVAFVVVVAIVVVFPIVEVFPIVVVFVIIDVVFEVVESVEALHCTSA